MSSPRHLDQLVGLVTLHATVMTIFIAILSFQYQTSTAIRELALTDREAAFLEFSQNNRSCTPFQRSTVDPMFEAKLEKWAIPKVYNPNDPQLVLAKLQNSLKNLIRVGSAWTMPAVQDLAEILESSTPNIEMLLDLACATLLGPPFSVGAQVRNNKLQSIQTPVPPLKSNDDVNLFITLSKSTLAQLEPLRFFSVSDKKTENAMTLLREEVLLFSKQMQTIEVAQKKLERIENRQIHYPCFLFAELVSALTILGASVIAPICMFFPRSGFSFGGNHLYEKRLYWLLVPTPFVFYIVFIGAFVASLFS